MTNWIIAISTMFLMIATVVLAAAAWQAKKSFLQESLYNDSWELYKQWHDLKTWVFNHKVQLDGELLTTLKEYSDIFREKLDAVNFLYTRVKYLYADKLEQMGLLLNDLDSVWITYATKQNSKDINKWKNKILKQVDTEDISSQLYTSILNKMK